MVYSYIIIIIIIRKDRQCKAGRERLTPYQSEDPNPTTPIAVVIAYFMKL